MELTNDVLGTLAEGRNLAGPTLGEAIGDGPSLLVFLRHLG